MNIDKRRSAPPGLRPREEGLRRLRRVLLPRQRAPGGPLAHRLQQGGRRDLPGPVGRARFMTGGGYRLLASANFGELVLGCINADFCVQIRIFQH